MICVIGKSHLMLKLKGETAPILDADFPCDARNGKEIWEKVNHHEHDGACVCLSSLP